MNSGDGVHIQEPEAPFLARDKFRSQLIGEQGPTT
jgi:hypothetical protein